MVVDNQRYTLEEARMILLRQECVRDGHDYDVVVNRLKNIPSGVACARCGEKWWLYNPVESPTQVIRTIDAPTQTMPRMV